EVPSAMSTPQKHLPAALPIKRGGWTLEPNRVAVGQAEEREEASKCVGHQSSVEMGELAGTDDDHRGQNCRDQEGATECFGILRLQHPYSLTPLEVLLLRLTGRLSRCSGRAKRQ